MRSHTLLPSAAILALSIAAAGLAACPQEGKVSITLVVILATEEGEKIDPKLKDFAKEVQEMHPQFKSFQIKTMTKRSLKPGEKGVFKLLEEQSAQIVVRHGADKINKVSLAVTAPNQGEIEYRTVCGKYLPIVTRYQSKSKERLMLAIQVKPCNDE